MTAHRVIEVLGSAEFEPWAGPVDRQALSRAGTGNGGVVIIPAAMASESDRAFDDEGRQGVEHFTSLGISASVLPLRTRADAFQSEVAEVLASVSMVFFAGGHPEYLASVLANTPAWAAVVAGWHRGMVVAGCSAGAWILGEVVPDSRATDLTSHRWEAGLRLVPGAVFAPHWNRLDELLPGLQATTVAAVPAEHVLVGIDERTAILGDGRQWQVFGEGGVLVRRGGLHESYRRGQAFDLFA
jgi:cyanophycinase-like exopeptidase